MNIYNQNYFSYINSMSKCVKCNTNKIDINMISCSSCNYVLCSICYDNANHNWVVDMDIEPMDYYIKHNSSASASASASATVPKSLVDIRF